MKRLVFIILFSLMILTPNSRDALGDVNNDGTINVLDIVRIVNIILENDPLPTDYELWASDVNLDGTTDVSDIILIVQVILGEDDCPYLYSPCAENLFICCPDTTSHVLTFEIDTLGAQGMFSWLNDVAVIDENNIWVVGEIHTEETDQFDSTGTWMQPYNAAHWDGEEWEMERIMQPGGYVQSIKCIDYISEDNIWFGKGSLPLHWNGMDYYLFTPAEDNYPGGNLISKIYHNSPEDLFITGYNGSIIHYDGTSFIQMESGTDVTLKSVTGTGPDNVWVSGHDLDIGINQQILLHYDGEQWNTIIDGPPTWNEIPGMISGVIGGVYTDQPDSVIIVTHLGFYKAPVSTIGEGYNLFPGIDWEGSIKSISGTAGNDIFFGGGIGKLWHYNGESVYLYNELPMIGNISSIGAINQIICSVGHNQITHQAFIIKGIRSTQ
ncbi:MAG: dockerin type I repeat-containing protein [Fidelibacterota bacterium]